MKLEAITELPGLQLRSKGLDKERVSAMVEFVKEGGVLPPITLIGKRNLLADGHHRYAAAVLMGKDTIEANHETGGEPEAIAAALRGNDSKALMPFTVKERNAGIAQLLEDGWTQARIGEATGLAQTTIAYVARSREAAEAYPNLPIASAAEVARVNGLKRGQNGKAIINIDGVAAIRDEVAKAVEGMEFQQVREVVRTVNEALRNDITPDVEAIVATVKPRLRADTPLEAYEDVKRILLAPLGHIKFNGTMVSVEEVIRTIIENPDANELRALTLITEDAAATLRSLAEQVIDMLGRALAPTMLALPEGTPE